MVTIESMCIDDGLLNGGKEGKSVGVICLGMGVVKGSVEGVSAELITTGADSIGDNVRKMVWFTRMSIHLRLLCDAGGVEFVLRADCRDFDVGLVRC